MDLKSYLAAKSERQSAFAERVGTTEATISRIIKDDNFSPGVELALKIEQATDGAVDAATLNKDVARVRLAA